VFSKQLTRIAVSGLFTFALLVSTTELKAGEHSSTFSSESSTLPDSEIDIFNPDLKKTFPFGDIVESDSGLNNDQFCNNCGDIESEEALSESNEHTNEH
jgi:hypothetical protein